MRAFWAVMVACLLGVIIHATVSITNDDDAEAYVASDAQSCSVLCARNVLTDINCGSYAFTTFAIQSKGDTTQKAYIGYTGMAAGDAGYLITGFEYCNGCLSGATYSGSIIKGKPKCVSSIDGGVRIAVEVFQ